MQLELHRRRFLSRQDEDRLSIRLQLVGLGTVAESHVVADLTDLDSVDEQPPGAVKDIGRIPYECH
jgi:hypothetical protein